MNTKNLILFITLFIFAACNNKDYFEKEDYDLEAYKRFELVEKVKVNINTVDGARCLLFDQYPFNEEGDLIIDPLLLGYSPISQTAIVGKHVDNLYLLTYNGLEVLPKEDVNIVGVSSRAIGMPDGLKALIDRMYPEGVKNVTDEEMLLSSDIVVIEDNTEIKLTFLRDRGSVSNQLSFYTYTNTNTEPQNYQIIFEDIKEGVEEGDEFVLGTFNKGTKIGFKQVVSGKDILYSTPEFNEQFGTKRQKYSSAIMRKVTYAEENYVTLGLEDRYYGHSSADYDYNDILFIMEATPDVDLENILPPPPVDKEKVQWGGYWLFEDNPLNESDYDFNDLVVKYKITEYGEGDAKEDLALVQLSIEAVGATHKNSFGINGKTLLSDVSGMINVYNENERVDFEAQEFHINRADSYIPYISNQTGTFDLRVLNAGEHPNVLDVPLLHPSNSNYRLFRWCLERTPISEAYSNFNNWVNKPSDYNFRRWYTEDPNPGTTYNR